MKKTNLTPAQLQVFVTIAETGSLTRAGQVLNLTQSGVSHALNSLEKTLGVVLFQRDRSGVLLTNVGHQLLTSARMLLAHIDSFEQSASQLAQNIAGKLRIGCFPSVASNLLPAIISGFNEKYNDIKLILLEGTDQEVIEWISSQQVDVGFITLPNDQFDFNKFSEDEFVVLLPKTHRYASYERISIAQLENEPFILSSGGCEPLIRAIFAMSGCYPSTSHIVRDINTIIALVNAGLGISIVPTLGINSGDVLCKPLEPRVTRQIGVAVRSWDTATPAAKEFIQFTENFRDR